MEGKYQEGKSYRFRVKSNDGLPLRVRAYEVAMRGGDTLVFSEVKKDGSVEPVKGYGYVNLCPGGRKNLCPVGYPRVPQAKCSGYSWSRNFSHDPDPKYDDLVFTIESGEAEIAWGTGYSGGSATRAGWVMVIDVLSAKITDVNYEEISLCQPDEVVVDYDVVVGATSQSGAKAEFYIDNVFYKEVAVSCGANQLRIPVTAFSGLGTHRISIGSVSDAWSKAAISSSLQVAVREIRVKDRPDVKYGPSTTDVLCTGCDGVLDLDADYLDANFRFDVERIGADGVTWESVGSTSQTGDFSLGPLTHTDPSALFTEVHYRVMVSNLDTHCDSEWSVHTIKVYKHPVTGLQYHIPN
ncbi:MAG: hypothetical protein IJU72_01945 [Bacteroidales bacterium]|nr:hypothetical protein [Bacteroidales bacterium]